MASHLSPAPRACPRACFVLVALAAPRDRHRAGGEAAPSLPLGRLMPLTCAARSPARPQDLAR